LFTFMALCTLAKRSSLPFMRASIAAVLSATASRHVHVVFSGCAENERAQMVSRVRLAVATSVFLQKWCGVRAVS
jgi:hypothetical protein